MNWQKFLASDAIVYGLKETVNNIGTALCSMLILVCEILVSIVVVGLPAITFSIWQVPELRVLAVQARTALTSGKVAAAQAIVQEISFSQLPVSVLIVCTLAFFALIALWFMFGAGYLRMIIKFHDAGTVQLKEMLMGWHRGFRLLCASCLYMAAVTVGLCLCIIPGLYIMVHGILYPFFIVDKNAGAFAALKMSFAAVKGYAWQVGAILLVLSLFSAHPFISFFAGFTKLLMIAHAYRRLTS